MKRGAVGGNSKLHREISRDRTSAAAEIRLELCEPIADTELPHYHCRGSIALILAMVAGTVWRAIEPATRCSAESPGRGCGRGDLQAEAQRLAAEGKPFYCQAVVTPYFIALLSLRSMNTQYTSQGDGVLDS